MKPAIVSRYQSQACLMASGAFWRPDDTFEPGSLLAKSHPAEQSLNLPENQKLMTVNRNHTDDGSAIDRGPTFKAARSSALKHTSGEDI
jgi:hypothetical protein